MNRGKVLCILNCICIPRAGGDEPSRMPGELKEFQVFPAQAGMNRSQALR